MVYSIFLYIPLFHISFQLFLMDPYQDLSLSFSIFQFFLIPSLPPISVLSPLFLFVVQCLVPPEVLLFTPPD